MKRFLALLPLCAAFFLFTPAYAQGTGHVSLRLLADTDAIVPGKPAHVLVAQTIENGWHTYWKNPGDSGEPMSVKWEVPADVTVGGLRWPAPHRVPYADLINYGYEGSALITADIAVPETFADKTLEITGRATVLVCKDICIPEDHTVTLSLPVAKTAKPANADMFAQAAASQPQPVNWPTQTRRKDKTVQVAITLPKDVADGIGDETDVTLFPELGGFFVNNADQNISVDETKDGTWQMIVSTDADETMQDDDLASLAYVVTIGTKSYALPVHAATLHATLWIDPDELSDDGNAEPAKATASPSDEDAAEGMGQTAKAPTVAQAEPALPVWAGGKDSAAPYYAQLCKFGSMLAQPGYWLMLWFAFLGGLILNLMPCVFPILSMKAMHLARMTTRERKHAVSSALFYALGVVATFAAVGFTLITLRAFSYNPTLRTFNENYGWGFQLQEPIIVAVLAWLLFTVGLMLFDWVVLRVRLPGKFASITEDNAGGAVLSGVLATLVATPCTAPFMATAMGATIAMDVFSAMGVFVFVGLGLAAPFVTLSVVPALQRMLPRPGAWMETFRQFLAFPMFLSTAWLAWVGAQQNVDTLLLPLLLGMVVIGFAVWLFQRAGRMRRMLGLLTLLLLPALGAYIWNSDPNHRAKTSIEIALGADPSAPVWSTYSMRALSDALSSTQPVFVNMTASWCITCLANERVALNTDETKAMFGRNAVLLFKGDWTKRNAEITEFLQRFRRNGVPLYIYYPAPDATGIRPQPVVLPQILTPSILREAVEGNTQQNAVK